MTNVVDQNIRILHIFYYKLNNLNTQKLQFGNKLDLSFLSTVGKATMLQLVLSAIPFFAMTCFELSVELWKKIQSELTNFRWNSKEGEENILDFIEETDPT